MPRSKEFNPDDALDHAMHIFWHKGYEASSMEDLLTAMGINRGSLYDTFGDKRQLFVKTLDHYSHKVGADKFAILAQPGPALPSLRRFLRIMIEGALADPLRRGCLLTNSVMELGPHEHDIALKLKQAFQYGEDTFFRLLSRAQEQGELARHKDPRALARFLSTLMQGSIVMIKSGAEADAVIQAMETALTILD
ncbi:hypothetical protein B566_EDAN000300 [Ephemera danica]|nr:hypothetical protein B566_EDAN000300 [Ephemera danica]